jgi:hypothetical protein
MRFIRGIRIWFIMFGSAQYLAANWYPTFYQFREAQKRIHSKEDLTDGQV